MDEFAMKLRDPRWIRRVAWVAAKLIRLWMGTIRYRSRFPATVEPGRPDSSGRYMFLFWHEHLLTPVNNRGWPNVHVLIGQHADGELIAPGGRTSGLLDRPRFEFTRGAGGGTLRFCDLATEAIWW